MSRGALRRILAAIGLASAALAVQASETPERSVAYKFTASHYANGDQPAGTDLNLRANQGRHVAWIGHYTQAPGSGEAVSRQTRLGYETAVPMPFGQLVPSVQTASGGFWGGSLTAQVGRPDLYAIVGWGRTNLRPYYNLNFDPNDAVTLGLGLRLADRSLLTAFVVRDDRLSTGQTVTHLVWRKELEGEQRITIDAARKQGRAEAQSEPVRGHMLSLAWDHRDLFVRVTRDRRVNFTGTDQTRVAAGVRF